VDRDNTAIGIVHSRDTRDKENKAIGIVHNIETTYKKNKDIVIGTFTYPLLMAADIVIMDADIVPVGKDQKQHIEMTREMVRDFNNTYGETFKEPQEFIKEEVETLPGTDGQKMSKSYKNVIPLIATDEEWEKAVFSIVSGSTPLGEPINPETCNIFALHKVLSKDNLSEIRKRYEEGSIGFKESKEILLENLKKKFGTLRDRFYEISDEELWDTLQEGRERAKQEAVEMIKKVRGLSGILK